MVSIAPNARRHLEHLRGSARLTATYIRMWAKGSAMAQPEDLIRLLNGVGVSFVVMGTHGVGSYRSEARATHDVDVLVTKRDHAKAIRAVQGRYPELVRKDYPVVTRFLDPKTDRGLIDLMKPTQEVFKMVFRHTVWVESFRIPDLEMALVSKFAAMTSPYRKQAKKYIDAGDFIDMIQTNQEAIDLAKLTRLANKVYPGGAKEIRKLMDDIAAERPITL